MKFKTTFVDDAESVMNIDKKFKVNQIRFHQKTREITIVYTKTKAKKAAPKKK